MDWSKFFSGASNAVSAGSGIVNTIYQLFRDKRLTGAQREANAFAADQAALERDWSSSEADQARQWQEDMYTRYNSPQAMIRQYQDAGLNPALMYGGATGQAAPTSTAVPSGSAASSVSPVSGDVAGALQMLYSLKDLQAGIQEKRDSAAEHAAGARERNANAVGKEIGNQYAGQLAEAEVAIKQATKNQLEESASLLAAQCETEKEKKAVQSATAALIAAQQNGEDLENAYKTWRNKFIEDNGFSPDQPIWNSISSLAGGLMEKSREGKQQVLAALVSLLRGFNSWYHDHSTDPITAPNPE